MNSPHIGVQVMPQSVFDEGPDHLLDTLQETCGATAVHVLPLTHAPYSPGSDREWANPNFADHGVTVPEFDRANLTDVFYRADPSRYDRPELVPKPLREDMVYAGRDVFDELAEPAARRGIEIHARICDWGHHAPSLPGSDRWCAVKMDGTRKPYYCPAQPEYQRWWQSIFADLFHHKPYLRGLNFGHERGTPLNAASHGGEPDCWCEHCLVEADRRGINPEFAKQGFRALQQWHADCQTEDGPTDGHLITFIRILRDFPDMTAWDRMWADHLGTLDAGIYSAVKIARPSAIVGWHIVHSMSLSPIHRIEHDYRDLAPYADYIKPVVYHDVAGVRFSRTLRHYSRTLFGDVPEATALQVMYGALQYDPKLEPSLDELKAESVRGFSPDYCAREVRRCKASGGRPVFAGVGFDIPNAGAEPGSSQQVETAVKAVFDAGAEGLVISREYHELQLENLRAVGRALKGIVG